MTPPRGRKPDPTRPARKMFSCSMLVDVKTALAKEAKTSDRSMSEIVDEALRQYLVVKSGT